MLFISSYLPVFFFIPAFFNLLRVSHKWGDIQARSFYSRSERVSYEWVEKSFLITFLSTLKFSTVKSKEIREVFLEFFKERGHTIVSSSPLLPPDPTLLFTNAGMNQFKPYFLGEEDPPFKRAASVQKCLRAGGKHNDLDNVGFTRRHHTFFEMLGNFSFGDYFKRKAIMWAWELLTKVYKLPPEKLWVSVYEEDEEAYDIWKDEVGIPPDRILRLGAKDNFWEMGDVGPCGPSSEILYDLGSGDEDERLLELWNLVFMQYNRRADGNLEPLPKKNIDTGMGLERLASVLQGTYSNFETDLFMPIINFIEDITGVKYTYETGAPHRVIADHTRALVFAISDGIYPANFGRGYVLRRILRRAYRFAQKLNIAEPILYRVADIVIETMGDVYPEIKENAEMVKKTIKNEEERFLQTLGRSIPILMEKLESTKDGILKGEETFVLYDTYGIPQDMIDDWATTYGVKVDWEGFRKEMEKARERSRERAKFKLLIPQWSFISEDYTGSKFVGYHKLEAKSKVAKFGKIEDKYVLVCYETPFYPEGGGQIGDVGEIMGKNWRFKVEDTKRIGSDIVHYGNLQGNINPQDECVLKVSKIDRDAARRAHTATHLLHASLRSILGQHVRQQGSLVERERLRFDFSHPKALTDEELKEIENLVNEKIRENMEVIEEYKPYREALKEGAIAIFEEKYGEIVRVITVGDFSKELCGGTHVYRTGDIGVFIITKEESVSAGTRRIEALVGNRALRYIQEQRDIVHHSCEILRTSANDIPKMLLKRLNEIKELKSEIQTLYENLANLYAKSVETFESDGKRVRIGIVPLPKDALRKVADRVYDSKSVIILTSSHAKDRGFVHIRIGKDLTHELSARDIMKRIVDKLGGGGGGGKEKAEGKIMRFENLRSVVKEVV